MLELEEARIIECDWNTSGGTLTYDISHLHDDWDTLTQTYTVESQTLDGKLVYGSEFLLFAKGANVPSSFQRYPKAVKAKLWQLIFVVKKKFFEDVQPDIVTHFIKQPHSIKQRFVLYYKWLALPDYDVDRTNYDIIYTRKTSPGPGGGFLLASP